MKIIKAIIFLTGICAVGIGYAQSFSYPTKAVRIIVPFLPGGAADIAARVLGQSFSEAWGQPVVVDNRTGAGGNIGAELASKAEPDGHTLLMAPGGLVTANPYLHKKLSYDPRKLIPISKIGTGPQVVLVGINSPATSVKSLIEYAKSRPDGLKYGSAGIGSQAHLAIESFLKASRIHGVHVPYRGSQLAMNMQELETAVRCKLNPVVLVLNNFSWGVEKSYQKDFFGKRYVGANIGNPRFDKLAEAFGCHGLRVERAGEIGEAVRAALEKDLPTVIDVIVDSDEIRGLRRDAVVARKTT